MVFLLHGLLYEISKRTYAKDIACDWYRTKDVILGDLGDVNISTIVLGGIDQGTKGMK